MIHTRNFVAATGNKGHGSSGRVPPSARRQPPGTHTHTTPPPWHDRLVLKKKIFFSLKTLVEKIVRERITESLFWKEECFGLTAETVIEKVAACLLSGPTLSVCLGRRDCGSRRRDHRVQPPDKLSLPHSQALAAAATEGDHPRVHSAGRFQVPPRPWGLLPTTGACVRECVFFVLLTVCARIGGEWQGHLHTARARVLRPPQAAATASQRQLRTHPHGRVHRRAPTRRARVRHHPPASGQAQGPRGDGGAPAVQEPA